MRSEAMARGCRREGAKSGIAGLLVGTLLLVVAVGCVAPDPRVAFATARAALGGGAAATVTPTLASTATESAAAPAAVTPSDEATTAAPLPTPTWTAAATLGPTSTPWPTATSTPTIAMIVGPAAPWLTVQARTSTPRPAYVPATPPSGPAVATIPPLVFPGSAAPTWTPAPTAFPIRPGEVVTGTPSAPSGPELELLSMAEFVDEAAGEFVVTGEVHNIGDRTLEGVTALVNLYDAQERFLATGSAPIVYPSLPPGLRSPFAVTLALRPGADHYTIQFLDGSGKLIETRDARG